MTQKSHTKLKKKKETKINFLITWLSKFYKQAYKAM